jgi:peptidyl-prolyl cis-trans isomerase D
MLEQLRRNSRSWLIWFIFAIIIAAFVLFFGPQSGPDMFGCGGASDTVAAEVEGEEIPASSWRFAMNGLGFGSSGGSGPEAAARRATAIDFLVERQLLAERARDLGFRVSTELVEQAVAEGEFYILGQRVDGKQIYFEGSVFNFDYLERYAGQLGLSSVDSFISEQKLEMMANFSRETLARAALVSDEEARADYIHRNTTITAEAVLFPLATYRQALQLSEADASRYLADHQDDVKAKWELEKAQFASERDRVLARHILIKKQATPAGADAGATEDPEARAEAALARVEGGEDFAAVAADVSDDERTRGRGGLIGWRVVDALGYGTAVSDVVKKLGKSETSKVIESPTGFHVIRVEDRADKALTFDQRKLEIAFELAAAHYARALARRDAEAALARVQAGGEGKGLADFFERPEPPAPTPGGQQLTPEQMEQIRRQIEEGLENPGDGAGWILREGEIVLAQAGGASEPTEEPAADAAPAAAGETNRPPKADLPGALVGELPAIEIEPPKVQTIGPLSRPPDKIAGVGKSEELIAALFETLEEGEVAGRVFALEDPEGFAIVELTDRSEADLDKLAAERGQIRERLELIKSIELVLSWTRSQCEGAAKAGEININTSFLVYDDDQPPAPYSACANLSERTVYQQLASRRPGALF